MISGGCDLPESQCILGAVAVEVPHIVEETQEIFKTLKADLMGDRQTQIRNTNIRCYAVLVHVLS